MSTTKAPHLLSVEDNSETQLLLKHMLNGDYTVSFAANAEEAIEALSSEQSFDALLVDINLGSGKSGTELLREIEARDDVGHLPAIAVTAYAMPGDRKALLDKGFDGYVGKPFTGDELSGTINEVLSAG